MLSDEYILLTKSNRDGARIWLEKWYDDIYSIHTDKGFVLTYASINYEPLSDDSSDYDFTWNGKKGSITSFDPSGGPYITLGYKIGDKVVSKIYSIDGNVLFKLKNVS